MSVRSMSTLAVGLLLVLAGCSNAGDGKDSSDGSMAQQESSSDATGPSYSTYADYPGQELLYNDGSMLVGLRMKPVETVWLTELAGRPAQPGYHFLAAYVVATGEKDDRGVADAHLDPLALGMRFGAGSDCKRDLLGGRNDPNDENCHDNATLVTVFWDVPYREWGEFSWDEGGLSGIPMKMGETMAGVVAFSIADSLNPTGAVDFCGEYGDEIVMEYDNCVTVPAPKVPRA